MQSIIKKVPKEDCEDLAALLIHAYPSPKGSSDKVIHELAQHLRLEQDQEAHIPYYGAYRNGKLLGALKLHEFSMTLRAEKVRVGGIAAVCVHFLHKKEKVSKDLLAFALKHFNALGINIVSLYPFQTEFYKKMGFGYGAMKHQYRIKPDAFPKGSSKRNIEYLTNRDRPEVLACYRQYGQTRTGMFERQEADLTDLFHSGSTVVGVKQDGGITGYLSFRFKRTKAEYARKYDMEVTEFITNTPEALAEICTFLHSQSDQIQQVILNTQDEDFHYLFQNPTNGNHDSFETLALETSVTAVGAMYRILSVKNMFAELSGCQFGPVSCRLKIHIDDNFFEAGHSSIVVNFIDGKASVPGEDSEYDAALSLDIGSFTSLMIGAVSFTSLYRYGLVALSDRSHLELIHQLFATAHKPRNETNF